MRCERCQCIINETLQEKIYTFLKETGAEFPYTEFNRLGMLGASKTLERIAQEHKGKRIE